MPQGGTKAVTQIVSEMDHKGVLKRKKQMNRRFQSSRFKERTLSKLRVGICRPLALVNSDGEIAVRSRGLHKKLAGPDVSD